MQAYYLLIEILLGGVGYANSLFLVLTQTFASSFFVVRTMFIAMRRRSMLVKTMAVLIPMMIGGTYILAASIIFGAFFSDAWSTTDLLYLVQHTLNYDFVYEALGWVGLFVLLTVLYTLLYRLKLSEWLLTFGLEILAALALLVLYGGLLIDGFPYTIINLCYDNIFLAKFPIYGLYMVIFKDYVLLVSLFIGTLLYERKRPIPSPEDYLDKQTFYEKQAARYLTTDYLALGGFMFAFGLAASAFFIWIFWYECGGFPDFDKLTSEEIQGALFLMFVVFVTIAFCIIGLLMIFRRLFPQTSRPYRQLAAICQTQPDPDAAMELFYQEMALPYLQNPENESWHLGKDLHSSAHFLIEKKGIRVNVKWRG